MGLTDLTQEAFAPGGALSREVPHFLPRDGQTQMALAIARTIEQGGALVVEAGTGVGKTFAYLVPALLSGERVLLSTATKTLQDQLFTRDLPGLSKALSMPVVSALLKGRSSYLCLHRLEETRLHGELPDRSSVRVLARIEDWARHTQSGDLAELPGLDERSALIPLVTSSRENCLGGDCPKAKDCYVNLARKAAMDAEVVVVNHHLFFADLAVRESGVAELLPPSRVVVFDEAHQLNETGVQFLGRQFGSGQVLDLARDLLAAGMLHAKGQADWTALCSSLEQRVREWRLLQGEAPVGGRLAWGEHAPGGTQPEEWKTGTTALLDALMSVQEVAQTLGEASPDLARIADRCADLRERGQAFLSTAAPGSVRWVELGQQARCIESPLDIAQTVRTRMLRSDDPQSAESGRAWIFTSATLGDNDALSWFTQPCGLTEAQTLRVQSPFDYPNQGVLYVPQSGPLPNEPGHPSAVVSLAARVARTLGGRTMVLTTTLRALRSIGQELRERLQDEPGLAVLIQGEGTRRELIERFRSSNESGQGGVVLVASASFWEGVDVPGDALQAVIIDKLPFPPPGDPLVDARSAALQGKGRSPFADYFLPEAAVALKQGAGRLIRRESDRGLLAVCDPRISQKGYGKRMLSAMPPFRRVYSATELVQYLRSLREPDSASSET